MAEDPRVVTERDRPLPLARARRMLGGLAAVLAMTGCASETLFQSSFNSNAVGAPPVAAQRSAPSN